MSALFALNPALNRHAIRAALTENRLVQVENFLTPASAAALFKLVSSQTPFGLAWAGDGQPSTNMRADALKALAPDEYARIRGVADQAAATGQFGYIYAQYPLVEAYMHKWAPGHPTEQLLEELNGGPVLDFARSVSGHSDIIKADGQITLYRPGDFLTDHDDQVTSERRRLAFVLNLAPDWKPDFGGYLNFIDARGNVAVGFMPRFNTLNLFHVPIRHNVSQVAPFAPIGRYAVTGWFLAR